MQFGLHVTECERETDEFHDVHECVRCTLELDRIFWRRYNLDKVRELRELTRT
jgi:hypothetical protein